ncbi:MAG: hypothetical protein CVU66_00670 [Deltaproteobacteria bacterium HGW-Deltaproteobacteria-23]|nr:MAG: hypothetical protein CVU66_00670 [Deltaproteobacteria bacterium HGW-Deltaproteobacteria-23]
MTPNPYILPGIDLPSEERIIAAVCRVYGIHPDQLRSKRRFRDYVEPRHIAMSLIKHCNGKSFEDIADLFNRDHSTVLYAVRTVSSLVANNKEFRQSVEKVINEVLSTPEDRRRLIRKILKQN